MNDFNAVFLTSYKGYPVVRGAIGFRTPYSAEQICKDNDKLDFILSSINERIIESTKLPVDQTIIFIPELID